MTKPSLITKLASRLCGIFLRIFRHVKVWQGVDAAAVIDKHLDAILNLPGQAAFFPTLKTDATKVEALVRRLHPVTCGKELIRLGPDGDGGYLVPDDLQGIEACFSPGVNRVSDFERDCADRGMKVFMADESVDGPAVDHPRFRFIKKFIGAATRENFISFEEWIGESAGGSGGDLLLQMDIEGYEYEALLSLPIGLQKRFRIIVVEFHYLDYLFSAPLFSIHSPVFEKLLSTHTSVHIHPNNVCGSIRVGDLEIPQMAEFTFLRSDRVWEAAFAARFPHPLDRDNCDKPPLYLPKSCYRAERNDNVAAAGH